MAPDWVRKRIGSILAALRSGPMTGAELSARLSLTGKALRRALGQLEKRGRVHHRPRLPVYRITDAGQDVLAGQRKKAHRDLLAESADAGEGGVAVAADGRRGVNYLNATGLIKRTSGPGHGGPPKEYFLVETDHKAIVKLAA